MILYILKSTIILFVLFSFYKLFLEKENMHRFKRFYLLGILIFAMIIPFNKIEVNKQETIIPIIANTNLKAVSNIFPEEIPTDFFLIENNIEKHIPIKVITDEVAQTNYWLFILLITLYGIGFTFFTTRFIINLIIISSSIKNNNKIKTKRYTLILLNNHIIPHSFFRFIFLNKQDYELKTIAPEVLLHEQTHVNQKHSFDVLFIEVLQVFFWFNPLLCLIKKSIKLNHEFLADQKILNQQYKIKNYQNLLLQYARKNSSPVLTSNINYSLTKKRLKMMTKYTSNFRAMIWKLTLIPIAIGLIFLLSTKVSTAQDINIKIKENNQILLNNDKLVNQKTIALEIKKGYNLKQIENTKAIIEAPDNVEMGLVTDVNNEILKAGITHRKYKATEIYQSQPTAIKIRNTIKTPQLPVSQQIDTAKAKSGWLQINNQTHFYSNENGKIIYYNRSGHRVDKNGNLIFKRDSGIFSVYGYYLWYSNHNGKTRYFHTGMSKFKKNLSIKNRGKETDKNGKTLEPRPILNPSDFSQRTYMTIMVSRKAKFYLNGKVISTRKAQRLARNKKMVHISSKDSNAKNPIVYLSTKAIDTGK